jgi:hypothetical protein
MYGLASPVAPEDGVRAITQAVATTTAAEIAG